MTNRTKSNSTPPASDHLTTTTKTWREIEESATHLCVDLSLVSQHLCEVVDWNLVPELEAELCSLLSCALHNRASISCGHSKWTSTAGGHQHSIAADVQLSEPQIAPTIRTSCTWGPATNADGVPKASLSPPQTPDQSAEHPPPTAIDSLRKTCTQSQGSEWSSLGLFVQTSGQAAATKYITHDHTCIFWSSCAWCAPTVMDRADP